MTKLPLQNLTLRHLRCLRPDRGASESLRESFRYLAKCAPQVIQSNQVSCLLDEVTLLSLEPLAADSKGPLDKHWQHIFELRNAENEAKYPLLTKLVKALLSVQHGNADVEHGFRQNNTLHERSSFSLEIINGIRHTMAFAKRFNSDPCQFSLGPDVLRAVRGSAKRYAERTAGEKEALKQLRTDMTKSSSSSADKTEAQAQKEVADAEHML